MTRATRPSFRPAIESLEARDVPATLIEVLTINPGAAGEFTPTVRRIGTDLVITGTAKDDSVTASLTGRGLIRLDFQNADGSSASRLLTGGKINRLVFVGGEGNDTFVNQTRLASVADGGNGDDVLVGGSGIDQFDGGDGNDVLIGNAGNDILWGGPGDDKLDGGTGTNILDGVSDAPQLPPDVKPDAGPGKVSVRMIRP